MAKEFLAVEGLTISHSSGSPVSGGSFTILSVASLNYFCKNISSLFRGVYTGSLSFSFSGGTHSSGTSGSAIATGTINFTSTKNKNGSFILRENDNGSMTGTYIPPSVPPPTVPFTSNVEISNAGQSKVRGE
jgi:hypothetical protein